MVNHFIMQSGSTESGFFLHNKEKLIGALKKLKYSRKQVILLGVTFALLDLAEALVDMDLLSA